MRVRVKICGMTRREDALGAAALGADALGFIFHPPSPRNMTIESAAAICAALPPFVTKVGVFVDAEPDFLRAAVAQAGFDVVQFHGQESPEFCTAFGKPFLKALRVSPTMDVRREIARYAAASGLLLDTFSEKLVGGTGKTFDWSRIPARPERPIVLSGGIGAHNVAEAVRQVQPHAIDVSSGVEDAPGIKDLVKINDLLRELRRATDES